MAVKRYKTKYAKAYHYNNPDTGEEEIISFVANANLMPVFKSIAGVELTEALDDYMTSLSDLINEPNLETIVQFDSAKTESEKLDVVKSNADTLAAMFRTANKMATVGSSGLNLIELLLIASHVCTLPESDWAEATALGLEVLPQEAYEDVAFAFEVIKLAFDWVNFAKKNSRL